MKSFALFAATLLLPLLALAQPGRAEVAAQRAALEKQFAAERAACQQRFAVSDCLEEVRLRQRAALGPVVHRERELAAEERKAQAAAQAERVREREVAAAMDESQRLQKAVTAPPLKTPAEPASHAVRAPEQAQAAKTLKLEADEAKAAERARQRAQREAEARARQVQHDQRESKKPAAAPLPAPSAPR